MSTDCDTNLSKSQPVPGIGSPSGFLPMCIQLYCQLRDLVVSFPQEGRLTLCIERILFRSSYGFIFAGWLTIPAWSGYFCEASPPSGYYPHPHLLYMIKQFFRTAFSNSFYSLFLYVFQGKINSWFLSTPEMENSMVVHRAIGVQQPTCL